MKSWYDLQLRLVKAVDRLHRQGKHAEAARVRAKWWTIRDGKRRWW